MFGSEKSRPLSRSRYLFVTVYVLLHHVTISFIIIYPALAILVATPLVDEVEEGERDIDPNYIGLDGDCIARDKGFLACSSH